MSQVNDYINNYLDESLTVGDSEKLESWLTSDAGNLREFATAIARDQQLRRAVNDVASVGDHQFAQPLSQKRVPRSTMIVKWILVASLLVAVCWFVLPSENSASTITFEGANAPVLLETEEGIETSLESGATFSTGTLQVAGDGTRANFTYPDGSSILLAGGAELKIASGGGMQLALERGTLAANVTPQTQRRRFVLRTPTAEAVAQGTSFVVDAGEKNTLLRVNRGTVKLRRLADSQVLVVAQNQEVRTENNSALPLQAQTVQALPSRWNASSTSEEKVTWFGKWNDGVLRAVPREIFRKDIDKNEQHYHAGAHNDFPGLVTLTNKSAVRIRYRIERPLNVGVFLSTHSPSWNFTGNFQVYLEEHKSPPDEDGWRTATIPIEKFQPLRRTAQPFQPGCVAATIFATTYTDNVGLEVSQLEVISIGDSENQ